MRGAADPAARASRTLRVGLTGPIGCGKSTVAAWLAELGAVVVDADAVARAVTAPGQPAHDEVLAHFGDAVRAPDGSLDRAALASLVFESPAALRDLESIVHPAVRPWILAAIADAEAAGASAVVIEAIKLVEGGLAADCHEIWLITCDPDAARARMLARGMSAEDLERRVAAQRGLADRLAPRASRVIDTSGDAAEVRARVLDAWQAARRTVTG